ncbi:MAG: hypothetical protein KUG82_21340 [Pseudomonadales bacterium]|nr:hypothetical protein [Pseudomonadales bacterium]
MINIKKTNVGVVSIFMLSTIGLIGCGEEKVPLDISVHVAGYGDIDSTDGVWVGTKGENKNLELINVEKFSDVDGLDINYMCHIAGFGDSDWLVEGQDCGSRGQHRALEGFAIRLSGPAANQYTVEYNCHLAGLGDLQLVSDGVFCGTRGQGRRLEAIFIELKEKSQIALDELSGTLYTEELEEE